MPTFACLPSPIDSDLPSFVSVDWMDRIVRAHRVDGPLPRRLEHAPIRRDDALVAADLLDENGLHGVASLLRERGDPTEFDRARQLLLERDMPNAVSFLSSLLAHRQQLRVIPIVEFERHELPEDGHVLYTHLQADPWQQFERFREFVRRVAWRTPQWRPPHIGVSQPHHSDIAALEVEYARVIRDLGLAYVDEDDQNRRGR